MHVRGAFHDGMYCKLENELYVQCKTRRLLAVYIAPKTSSIHANWTRLTLLA
jgi:hypothetical protein